jgi:putative membrane protein
MARIPGLTDDGRASVGAAVAAVERHTAGEVVTIVTQQSDDYAEIALLWSAFVAFLALAVLALFPDFYLGIYDRLTGGWVQQWHPRGVFAVALVVAVLTFAGMWLLQLWRPLRLFLVPGPVKNQRVRARAIMCFKVGAERRTHGRTGILIYLSMAEHRAEIVADEAIASKVAPEVWGEAMAAMLAYLREGRLAEGMVAAIDKVGEVLAEHFPLGEGDSNELPDRLIEV